MQEILSADRTEELLDQMNEIASRLRKITKETGANIRIIIEHNKSYPEPCSYIKFGSGYIFEHLYNGDEPLKYNRVYEIKPNEVRWTIPPEQFETRTKK